MVVTVCNGILFGKYLAYNLSHTETIFFFHCVRQKICVLFIESDKNCQFFPNFPLWGNFGETTFSYGSFFFGPRADFDRIRRVPFYP